MSETVAVAKAMTEKCRDRVLKTFSFVPDDKLTFTPSPTAKSALALMAHLAVSNHGLAAIIRRESPKFTSPAEFFAFSAAEEAKVTTREQAVAVLEASIPVVLAALDSVTDADLAADVASPFFTAPLTFWINLPGRHMDNHAAQIDYLQTIWGDMEFHM